MKGSKPRVREEVLGLPLCPSGHLRGKARPGWMAQAWGGGMVLPQSDRAGSSFPRTYWQLPPCLPKWEGCGCFPASPGVLEFQKKTKTVFILLKSVF